MKPYVNLAKPDWLVSWQGSVASSADIRHSEVTKMFDVVTNYTRYVIFENNKVVVFLPTGRLAPPYTIL